MILGKVIGTVDMIGSRLLFSAYGRLGPWGRALEAAYRGLERGRAGLQRALRSERLLALLGSGPLLG